MKTSDILIIAASSAVLGGLAGSVLTHRIERSANEHYVNSELQNVEDYWKKHYRRLYKGEGYSTPQEAVESMKETDPDYREATKTISGAGATAKEWLENAMETQKEIREAMAISEDEGYNGESEEEEQNVFEKAAESQDPTIPRHITIEEFMQDMPSYEKVTLTYFEDDDTLISEKDERAVEDQERLVGGDFVDQFGMGSKDHDTVYVRNEALELDFEITRDRRSYAEFLMGPEEKKPPRKMRSED